MPRMYRVLFSGVSVSAAQDLVSILGATGKVCRIIKAWAKCVQTSAPTDQQLQFRCRVLPATVTPGSGGGAFTPAKVDPGDAAASFTARINDTTPATTNGTAVIHDTGGENVKAGYEMYFPEKPPVGPSQSFVFELLGAPSGTLTMSGGLLVEEIGG